MIEEDATQTKFSFSFPVDNKKGDSTILNKIRDVLLGKSITLEDDEVKDFASFGFSFGNDDFINPLKEQYPHNSKTVDEDSVIDILTTKKILGIKDMKTETDFIAERFMEMIDKEEFFSFSKDPSNIDILKEIFQSNKFIADSEDDYLSFLLEINKSNMNEKCFASLFSYCQLEYCSTEKYEEFVEFAKEKAKMYDMEGIIACIERRLSKSKLSINQPYDKQRHNPINGILRRENKRKNALLEASSSMERDDVYLLLNDDPSEFRTKNIRNSYIQVSLKDGKTFNVESYAIKGRTQYDACNLQSWKIEGKRASDDMWILLDQHLNDPIEFNETIIFNVSCTERLKCIRLTQTGENTNSSNQLFLSRFDIKGKVYEK